MKIAVCGKGGCGKSTVTSLLAKALARRGKEILVIDSDESNYGLHRQLGMKLPRDFTDYFGAKQNVLNDMMLSKFTHQFFEETWTIDDIPEDYYSLKDGVKLMDMEAGIEHFGRGIDNGVDLILIIIDPSYESLQLSKKIGELSESIQKPFYYVLNKVTKENQEMMYEAVWNSSRVAVSLSADPGIMGEGLMGKELSEKPDAIENLTEFLLSI